MALRAISTHSLVAAAATEVVHCVADFLRFPVNSTEKETVDFTLREYYGQNTFLLYRKKIYNTPQIDPCSDNCWPLIINGSITLGF